MRQSFSAAIEKAREDAVSASASATEITEHGQMESVTKTKLKDGMLQKVISNSAVFVTELLPAEHSP